MRTPGQQRKIVILWMLLILAIIFVFKILELQTIDLLKEQGPRAEKYTGEGDYKTKPYNRKMPLIFIGGVPRSGTTLMRAMLDAHPDVRCGQETHIIPGLLSLRAKWTKMNNNTHRLEEGGVTKEIIDDGIAEFLLKIITKHGDPAPRLCNKDPFTLMHAVYLLELFPNAKFLFMVRDGRATVHSIITRQVVVATYNMTNYRQSMTKWNKEISIMHQQCQSVGTDHCMMVYYEQLVLHPSEWMEKILEFLDIPWNDAVLHHEEFINKPNGVPLSKVEPSSDQIIKPVNLEALTKWVGQMPDDVVRDMADVAPMLSVLGYDPYSNPPEYGKPDAWVKNNTIWLKANRKLWEDKAKNEYKLKFWWFE